MTKIIATHDGKFHADDVCAVSALALLIDGPIEVIRTRDPELIAKADFVVDVGGVFDEGKNRFDHHQEVGAGERENGIPYAAFGLVWKTYGEKLCGSKEVAKMIEKGIVQPVDAIDNGVDLVVSKFDDIKPFDLGCIVNAFRPTWKEGEENIDIAFAELVRFMKTLLAREIMRMRAKVEVETAVIKAYENTKDKRVIILDMPFSREDVVDVLYKYPEPLYFLRPVTTGDEWPVVCVRDNPQSFVNRKDLPREWAGKKGEEFAKICGVPDAIFCHRTLFMAVAGSKEGAIALTKRALEL
ncbi:MAG: MYG1 family protein [bacterium]